ncbi:tyrosine-protein phosphatase [Flavihumibacter sp. UBA7668]|uniref:tyrosine-protein phosphatase n=1 Tax=Flavihumibacter sp. UBA7668 TaxID=1946542 RepID=UPI0025BB6186|nr:CpsB/CapC family capsule biosynthesis tyrosine phosphatase [Flavihumibacter sp. UBA7668]
MLFFKKKTQPRIDLSGIGTDMHSHLLPGIDDGAPDAETGLQLLTGLQELGLQGFITTPHILWDLYKNTNQTIEPARHTLQAELTRTNNPATLSAAAEYLIDDYFSRLLQNKAPLRCLRDNYVLVEFSFVNLPFDWKQVFFDLQIQGYQPVLAHPERYSYLFNKWTVFDELRDMGILLQVNLNSLTGYYGKPMLQQAQQLIKQNRIAFLGSDMHHQRHLDALRQSTSLMPLVQETLASPTWIGFR